MCNTSILTTIAKIWSHKTYFTNCKKILLLLSWMYTTETVEQHQMLLKNLRQKHGLVIYFLIHTVNKVRKNRRFQDVISNLHHYFQGKHVKHYSQHVYSLNFINSSLLVQQLASLHTGINQVLDHTHRSFGVWAKTHTTESKQRHEAPPSIMLKIQFLHF